MSSFFGFAWSKPEAEQQNYPVIRAESDGLGVSASSSTDTFLSEAPDGRIKGTAFYMRDTKHPPRTPEGLRRRKTTAEIRQEWNLPSSALEPAMADPGRFAAANYNYRLPPTPNMNRVVPPFLYQEDEMEGSDASPYSPPISNSSMFSSSPSSAIRTTPAKRRPVAQSPDLSLPKTAVGALLSNNHAYANGRRMAASPKLRVDMTKTAVGAVVAQSRLQTHTHHDVHAQENEWWAGQRNGDFDGVSGRSLAYHQPSPHTLALGRYDGEICPSQVKDSNVAFTNLNDSVELPMYEKLEDDRSEFSPPISEDGSSVQQGSPSPVQRAGVNDTSFTRAFLHDVNNRNTGPVPYDLEPIATNEDYDLPMTHVQEAQPGAAPWYGELTQNDDEFEELGTKPSVVYEKPRNDWKRHKDLQRRDFQQRQRRVKEDLLLSTLERLQDNPDLLLEVVGEQTPDKLNIVSGVPFEVRDEIVKRLEVLSEQVLQSFRFTSFRNGLSQEHDVVTALAFAHLAMKCAVPPSEKPTTFAVAATDINSHGHRWKALNSLSVELGLEDGFHSPVGKGEADLSIFSLPSSTDQFMTPQTSNVSMTTTITSVPTPERATGHKINLRGTVVDLNDKFAALSEACASVLTLKDTSVAIATIKTCYLRLMTTFSDELKALVDSFQLEALPIELKRLVSEDQHDEGRLAMKVDTSILKDSTSLLTNGPGAGISTCSGLAHLVEDSDSNEGSPQPFSPATEDMESIEHSLSTMDDLRRTMGSFDRDDDVEETREASPPPVVETQEAPVAKKSFRRRLWKRRPLRRILAAE